MSDLPDIDTDAAGLCAFWNAIEQSTVDSIDPSDVTSDGRVQSQTIYDNGIEGEYLLANNYGGHNCYYRVKTDGWIVVYLESEDQADYGKDNNNTHGQFDASDGWGGIDNSSSGRNYLEKSVESLAKELSDWSTIGNYYNTSDVGMYSFDWTGANGVTLFSEAVKTIDDSATSNLGLIPTSGTTVHHFSVVGGTDGWGGGPTVSFEGNDVITSADLFGSRNMLPLLGGSLTEGQEYTGELSVYDHFDACLHAVLIWE